jgi:hypothetical protein
MTDNPETLVLRVSLNDVEPEIWRLIEVAGLGTLGTLHGALVGAMGWDDSHLHSFMVDDEWYSPVYESMETVGEDEEDITIANALPDVGSSIRWMYDWGDGWDHTITVQDKAPMQRRIIYPVLHDGARACPPEDCGGAWGYMEILAMLADPDYEPQMVDRDEIMEWLGDEFDPDAFYPKRNQHDMRNPRPKDQW